MKNIFAFRLILPFLLLSACAPRVSAEPAPVPTETAQPQLALDESVDELAVTEEKHFQNVDFGISFDYPAGWFGPDEYVSGNTLRVAVGSDTVYPYGTDRTEQIYTVPDSYYLTMQYTKGNVNTYWEETYQTLAGMRDGGSSEGTRGRLIRISAVTLGDFSGFEFIATLSDTAQTEPVYVREVMLVNAQNDLLTLSGSPNNIEIPPGANWREIYRVVDEQNQAIFHRILSSIKIK